MEHTDNTAAGRPLSEQEIADYARQLIAEAYAPPTSYRDDSPVPAYGPTPPVAQPGRPPMSQRATDVSGLMLSGSVAALSLGGATSLVLWSLGQVDPIQLALGAAGPVALVLAVAAVVRRLQGVQLFSATHNHYTGSVRQETTHVSSTTKGVFARTRNDVR
ncbi:hypothetical protein ACODT4_41335 [Streptomyces sp. 2.9]|uniref:hypothetical protein n=1 Tax=Streptomyces tritrimontium TaxID=3406573 RepID=UPI003BB50D2C